MTASLPIKTLVTWAAGGMLALAGAAGFIFFCKQKPVYIDKANHSAYESAMRKREEALKLLDAVPKSARQKETKKMDIFTESEANTVLHKHEQMWTQGTSKDFTTLQVYANQVDSNSRIEDYYVWTPLETSLNANGKPSQFMFGVFDGHAGYRCAEHLQAKFASRLNEAIAAIKEIDGTNVAESTSNSSIVQIVQTIKDELMSDSKEESPLVLAVWAAFRSMEKELVIDSVAEYKKEPTPDNVDKLLGPAVSGSCAVVAVLDTNTDELVVANIGDSRAILVSHEPDGSWETTSLSVDHDLTHNNHEVMRMIKDHPGEDFVIENGRVLGGNMVPRAFGDCRYKWPVKLQDELFPLLFERGHWHAVKKNNYFTPPYIIAEPDIKRFVLGKNDMYLVLISDGVTFALSTENVGELVGDWHDAKVGKSNNQQNVARAEIEKNPASLLIHGALGRDALGRIDEQVFCERLTLPPPHSRYFRDDMTALVIKLRSDSVLGSVKENN